MAAKIAARMDRMAPSGIRKVNEKALAMERAGEKVLHFEIGRPDFDTPEYIKKAACQALSEGKVHYTSNFGLMELRQAIADKLKRENNIDCKATEVLVTVGLSEAVFAVLAFELFLLAKWAWTGMPFVWFTWDYSAFGESWRSIVVLAAGLVLSLYWFRRHGQKSGPMPKWLLPALAAVLAFALVMMGLTWHQFGPKFLALFSEMNYETLMGTSLAWQITLYRELLIDGGTVCPFIALAGLILAKCYDRRWLALYTLALTAAALCLLVELHLLSMDVSILDLYEIRPFLFARLLPIGAAGLIGTGVALC